MLFELFVGKCVDLHLMVGVVEHFKGNDAQRAPRGLLLFKQLHNIFQRILILQLCIVVEQYQYGGFGMTNSQVAAFGNAQVFRRIDEAKID